jgi:hypothetical protein
MKNLSMLLTLFFWGVVLNCLRLMVGAYPGFTQSLFCGQVLSSFAERADCLYTVSGTGGATGMIMSKMMR